MRLFEVNSRLSLTITDKSFVGVNSHALLESFVVTMLMIEIYCGCLIIVASRSIFVVLYIVSACRHYFSSLIEPIVFAGVD